MSCRHTTLSHSKPTTPPHSSPRATQPALFVIAGRSYTQPATPTIRRRHRLRRFDTTGSTRQPAHPGTGPSGLTSPTGPPGPSIATLLYRSRPVLESARRAGRGFREAARGHGKAVGSAWCCDYGKWPLRRRPLRLELNCGDFDMAITDDCTGMPVGLCRR
jgi:hypothetical protein